MKSVLFILVIIYATYLTLEKYVITGRIFGIRQSSKPSPDPTLEQTPEHPSEKVSDVVGSSRFQMGQSVNNTDYSRQSVASENNNDTFTPERQPFLSEFSLPHPQQSFPQSKNNQGQRTVSPATEREIRSWRQRSMMEHIERDRSINQSHSAAPSENYPERHEVIGHVSFEEQKPRATGVTFGDMEAIHKVLADDQPSSQMQRQARDTFQRLEGTDIERLLRASILGSSNKLQRYMNLYLSRPAPSALNRTTKESILGLFDIEEFV